jgi:IS30 family transposase
MDRELTARQHEEIWDRRAAGESMRSIARSVGKAQVTVRELIAKHGGVRPLTPVRSERHLSLVEREEISRGLARGESSRQIAARLGRAPSTISREIARNGSGGYRACTAELRARRRARRPKTAKLARCRRLRLAVEAKLALRWSPQQIASWLAEEYPEDPEMRVSHETIYMSLFIQGRGALRQELHKALRTGRAIRRPSGTRQPDGRGILRDMVLISERPAEVKDRAVPGHWEGDLIFGKRMTAIGTLVERSTRYVMLFALPDGHTADKVRKAMSKQIRRLPVELRRSLTLDQGREFAEHVAFSVETGVQVYFCDPKSPWQRGSNENTNGLLRQYFPRNSDLSVHSQAHLNAVARQLNGRPRQTLGWKPPSKALAEAIAMTG